MMDIEVTERIKLLHKYTLTYVQREAIAWAHGGVPNQSLTETWAKARHPVLEFSLECRILIIVRRWLKEGGE